MVRSRPDGVVVEWFVSSVLRGAAADEQRQGLPTSAAALTHESARRWMHQAISGIVSEAGYAVEVDAAAPERALRVSGTVDPGGLRHAQALQSLLAELDKRRDAEPP
jgi:hypothetical protein